MNLGIRTDLALENREVYLKSTKIGKTIPGVEIETDTSIPHLLITKVTIRSKEGSDALHKPIGTYITIESHQMNSELEEIDSSIIHILSHHLKALAHLSPSDSILIVGLGNSDVTPDALGPKVVQQVQITSHLLTYAPEYLPKGTRPISAIIPGVLGTTGIETSEIVKGIVEKVKPQLVLVVDALASKSLERISNTIQISDSGIIPGSGVGNSRFAITKKELNVPVIVIGVPTVVGIATIVEDAITILEEKIDNPLIKNSLQNENYVNELLQNQKYDFMVTPKEIDDIITNLSRLLAQGINQAFGVL